MRTNPLSIVQVYHSYIWTVVNNTITRGNQVVDKHDLFQSGALALMRAFRKNDSASYLKTSIRHAVHKQASTFHGCFTIGNHVIQKVSQCRKKPSLYEENDPVYRLTFHQMEEVA